MAFYHPLPSRLFWTEKADMRHQLRCWCATRPYHPAPVTLKEATTHRDGSYLLSSHYCVRLAVKTSRIIPPNNGFRRRHLRLRVPITQLNFTQSHSAARAERNRNAHAPAVAPTPRSDNNPKNTCSLKTLKNGLQSHPSTNTGVVCKVILL